MEINKISNSPNFQAKIIINDERIHKFIKSSFISGARDTFDTLEEFNKIHPESIVSIGIKNVGHKDYLIAKNGITGATEKKFIHDTEILKLEDHCAFIDLIKRIMKENSFWTQITKSEDFNTTHIAPRIEHDVFKLDK